MRQLARQTIRFVSQGMARAWGSEILEHSSKARDKVVLFEDSQRLISSELEKDGSTLIGRFGRTELSLALFVARRKLVGSIRASLEVVSLGENPLFLFEKRRRIERSGVAPFFPFYGGLFTDQFEQAASALDILGSWLPGESYFLKPGTRIIPIDHLEPYFFPNPWSHALAGKRVLVIHPFAKSVEQQYYTKRLRLFERTDVLPEFELKTLIPPRAYFGEISGGRHWFRALEETVEEALRMDFDIALIAAGPMGLMIGAQIKAQGRKAIHLGGALQVLFGILGGRWEGDASYRQLFNRHWVRPSAEERPARRFKNEPGAYW